MKTITVTNSCDDNVISTSEALDLSSGTDTLYLSSTSVNSNTLGVTNISITGVECIDTSASTTVITINMSGQAEDFIVTGANKLEDTITTGAGNELYIRVISQEFQAIFFGLMHPTALRF